MLEKFYMENPKIKHRGCILVPRRSYGNAIKHPKSWSKMYLKIENKKRI